MRYMLSTAYIPYKERVMLYAFTGVLQRFCKLQYTWPLILHSSCAGLAWLGLTVPTPYPMLHYGSLYPPLLQVSDFLHCEGKVSLYREEVTTRQDCSLLSSLYSYWLLSNDQSGKALTPSEIKARKTALKCIRYS